MLNNRDPKSLGGKLASHRKASSGDRASIALDRCARAHAWLAERDYVTPEDVQSLAFDVLRHRVLLTYEAEAEGMDPDRFIAELIKRVPVP